MTKLDINHATQNHTDKKAHGRNWLSIIRKVLAYEGAKK
jgi:hypothetical protein